MYRHCILIITSLFALNACLYQADKQIIGARTAEFPLDTKASYYDATSLAAELKQLQSGRDRRYIKNTQRNRLKGYLDQALVAESRQHKIQRQGHCYQSGNTFAAMEAIEPQIYLVSLSRDRCAAIKQKGNFHIAIIKLSDNVIFQLDAADINAWAKQKTGLKRFFLNIKWNDTAKKQIKVGGKRAVKQFYQDLKKQGKLNWKALYIKTPLSPKQQKASNRLRQLKADIKQQKLAIKRQRQQKAAEDKLKQKIAKLGLLEKTPTAPKSVENYYLVYKNGKISTLQASREGKKLKEMLIYPLSSRNGRSARIEYDNGDRIQIEDIVRGNRKQTIIQQDRSYRSCPYLYDNAINYQLYPIKEAESQWYWPNRWRLAQISAACKTPRFDREQNLYPCQASCSQWHNNYQSKRDGVLLFRYLKDAKRFAQSQGR